jgi:hypothetical protein
MKSTEADRIPIVGFLAAVGITPQKVKNGAAWYISPLQPKTRNLFKVDLKLNRWHDTETNTGGNIINLVMQLKKTEILGALIILQRPELLQPLLNST